MKSRFLMLLTAFMLVTTCTMFVGVTPVSADDGYIYQAYDGTGKKPHTIVYKDDKNKIEAEWSLCMNRRLAHPGTSLSPGASYRKVENPSLEQMNQLSVPSEVTAEKYQQFKRVLYYYVKNHWEQDVANGNLYYWRGLQYTFWSLEEANPINTDDRYSPEVDQFYRDNVYNDTSLDVAMEAEGFQINVYIEEKASARTYQNLISAVFNEKQDDTDEPYTNPDGSIKTTVKAGDKGASSDKEVSVTAKEAEDGLNIVDAVEYEGLVGGKTYEVIGEIYEVENGEIVGEAIATAKQKFEADASGAGTWDIDFGTVTGLKAGKSYVLFETAVSEENLVDTDGDNKPDAPQEVAHKNVEDKAQTISVEESQDSEEGDDENDDQDEDSDDDSDNDSDNDSDADEDSDDEDINDDSEDDVDSGDSDNNDEDDSSSVSENKDNSPNTSDSMNIGACILMMLMSMGAIVALRGSRKRS